MLPREGATHVALRLATVIVSDIALRLIYFGRMSEKVYTFGALLVSRTC